MTVKELKNRIRELTGQVNNIIAEVRGRDKNDVLFEKAVDRLKRNSRVDRKDGYVGYGFEKKHKDDLERQLTELEVFVDKEWYSNDAKRREEARNRNSYNTFCKRYGYVTPDEWLDFVYMMNGMKNYLNDFGYEDIGRSIARAYAESSQKSEFGWHLRKTIGSCKGKGCTPEDFVDTLNDILIEEGAIDE